MQTVTDSITVLALESLAASRFGDMVKAVVDVARGLMIVDADMHADEEAALLDDGSTQRDLWGINLYPERFGTPDFVEFDSMVNLRPSQHNRSTYVEDAQTRAQVLAVVARLVSP